MNKNSNNEEDVQILKQQQQHHHHRVNNSNSNSNNTNNTNNNNNNILSQTIQKPCIIGVIGESSQGKHLFLNKLADKLIFHQIEIQFNKGSPDESIKIEIYNDQLNNNIYVNLNSFHDTNILIEIWNKVENMNTFEIEKWLEDGEFIYLKSLLFLFHICNIIFLVVENLTIKLEYFLMFRILKHIKNLVSSSIMVLLGNQFNLNAEGFTFLTPGKSIPILQIFLVKDLSEGYSLDSHLKLEDSLKKQITILLKSNNLYTTLTSYLTLKKQTTTTTTTTSQQQQQFIEPLFLIETNRPLVRLIRLYQINSSTINSLFQLIRSKNFSTPFNKQYAYYSQLQQTYESNQHNIPMACINSFKQFLLHNKLKNHDITQWEQAIEILSSNQVFDKKELFSGNFFNSISNIDQHFSNKLCQNYFTTAIEQYTESLPSSYGVKIHNSRLNKAIKSLCLNAGGPSLEVSIQLLREECEKIWKKSRKLCEKESFTGRLCNLNTHLVPSSSLSPINPTTTTTTTPTKISNTSSGELETRPHSSGYRTRSTCNCGGVTKLREDVFDIELGNSLFYQQPCCEQFQSIPMPTTKVTYQPYKSYDRVEYQTPFSWFNILVYDSNYTPENNDGYFVTDPVLQQWEMKKIFTHNSSNKSTTSQQQQQQKSNNNYPSGKLSFEYQCPTGHRFFEKMRSRKFFVSSSSPSSSSPMGKQIHIFFQKLELEACIHPDCNYMSQLCKVYIQSSIELLVSATIEISQSDKQPCDKWSYQMNDYVPIVRDRVYCIRLPFVFEFKNSPIPLQLSNPQSSSFFLNILINPDEQ